MGFTFVLNTKSLRGNEVSINNCHFMSMTHRIINIALVA
jgi:hypothetical protein